MSSHDSYRTLARAGVAAVADRGLRERSEPRSRSPSRYRPITNASARRRRARAVDEEREGQDQPRQRRPWPGRTTTMRASSPSRPRRCTKARREEGGVGKGPEGRRRPNDDIRVLRERSTARTSTTLIEESDHEDRLFPLTLIAAAVLAGCSPLPANNSMLEEARSDLPQRAVAARRSPRWPPASCSQAGNSWTRPTRPGPRTKARARSTIWPMSRSSRLPLPANGRSARRGAGGTNAAATRTPSASRREPARAESRRAQCAVRAAAVRGGTAQRRAVAARVGGLPAQRAPPSATRRSRQRQASQRDSESVPAQRRSRTAAGHGGRHAANAATLNARHAAGRAEEPRKAARPSSKRGFGEMEAKQTERGMVVTLGDVLFDTDEAQLKSGGVRNVQRLAEFFKEYPQRTVMIEGFTDSTGSDGHNQRLSERRAESAAAPPCWTWAWARIAFPRTGTAGPTRSPETTRGWRQMNRRVEVVVSDEREDRSALSNAGSAGSRKRPCPRAA